jgi:hypothetical protein
MKNFGKIMVTGTQESENTALYIMDEGMYAEAVVVCTLERAKELSLGGSKYIGKLTVNHSYSYFGTYENMIGNFISRAYDFLENNGYIKQNKIGLYFLTDKCKEVPEC